MIGTAELPKRFECEIEIGDEPGAALALLSSESGLSRSALKDAMRKGAVWHCRGPSRRRWRRADKTMRTGDRIQLYYDAELLASVPPQAQLIADEGAYSVWFKPYGMLSQGSRWADHFAIDRWVEQNLQPQRPAFLVHRLDRATTGLILIGHRKTTTAQLAALFRERTVSKRYRAIVHGQFPANEERLIDQAIDGRPAKSRAKLLQYRPDEQQSLVEVAIESGRKHQIRRHLAAIGVPILGDRLYGETGDSCDLNLCAHYLSLTCPMTGERRTFTLPEAMILTQTAV